MPAKRGPKPLPADHPTRATVARRGGRRELKDEAKRVMLTFLYMKEQQYKAAAARFGGSSHALPDAMAAGMARRLHTLAEACGAIAQDCVCAFNDRQWQEAVAVALSMTTGPGRTMGDQ